MIASTPDVDVEYLEQFIFQVMNDEFEINIEDGSGDDIASQIIKLRRLTLEGDFALVDEMYAKWQERQRRGEEAVRFEYVENGEGLKDGDEDSVDLERSADEDIEMEQNLSTSTSLQAKPQPIMDEDGFIKVVHKKTR